MKRERPPKKKYQKPKYRIVKEMSFPFDAVKAKKFKAGCRQCSSCHGCR